MGIFLRSPFVRVPSVTPIITTPVATTPVATAPVVTTTTTKVTHKGTKAASSRGGKHKVIVLPYVNGAAATTTVVAPVPVTTTTVIVSKKFNKVSKWTKFIEAGHFDYVHRSRLEVIRSRYKQTQTPMHVKVTVWSNGDTKKYSNDFHVNTPAWGMWTVASMTEVILERTGFCPVVGDIRWQIKVYVKDMDKNQWVELGIWRRKDGYGEGGFGVVVL